MSHRLAAAAIAGVLLTSVAGRQQLPTFRAETLSARGTEPEPTLPSLFSSKPVL